MFVRNDLDELVGCDKRPAVSIYMPTHSAGREVRQDAIRLRNLLSTATKRLAAEHRPPDIAELLDPARRLVDDEEFWRYQACGLGVFLAPGFHRVHKLPVEVAEELFVGAHFCIRPLLPMIDSAGRFWVLTVSAGRTRLYQGTRWGFDEFPGIELPQGVQEIYDETVFQEGFKAGPTGRPQRGAPTAMAKSQATETPEDVRKAELLELLRRIKAAVEPAIKSQPAPIVLAAHERAAVNGVPAGGIRIKSSVRHELSRRRRRLEEAWGGAVEVTFDGGDDAIVERFLALEHAGWKGAAGTSLLAVPGHGEFFRAMCREFRAQDRLVFVELRAGDRLAAARCLIRAGDTAFFLKTAYEQALSAYAPGVATAAEVLERLDQLAGVRRLDSCSAPDNAVLNRLMPDRKPMVTLAVPARGPAALVARGALPAALWLRDRLR
jgi:hypothetical protein